ncbi:sensor histidine kinase [Dictyobacter arantiisoli]|uniref:histidine kinase n=1 Tax=Dictyobacter arantiisoli TaxID=2014874 RepID=A0A5A5TDT0_9CHLR|nr:GAF domain-containing sensor histidine kinase [Dictyobacter arantiisoli]GCF09572.1 hypothetical protein KDI_31360 [Dictyobacter arantiisoli]
MGQFKQKTASSEADRFEALSRISIALMSERDEASLLHLIAQTAVDLTGATYAAFTLRPTNEQGEITAPSEGSLFYLAAIVGVTEEENEYFRHLRLGGEGLLGPIFRHGVAVRIGNIPRLMHESTTEYGVRRNEARAAAFEFAHGQVPADGLRTIGMPHGHPTMCSFLGVPLLNRDQVVLGGLLLGHPEPEQFTENDERLLVGMAAQAAVALENTRLYQATYMQAQEVNAVFQEIADGVTLVDQNSCIVRENARARHMRERLLKDGHTQALEEMLYAPAARALAGQPANTLSVQVPDDHQEKREYVVRATPLHFPEFTRRSAPLGNLSQKQRTKLFPQAVVVWHDVTEAQRLMLEQRIHAETEAQRSLLQTILDELPSSVYLVRGKDARLVLANQAAKTVWGAEWPRDKPMQEFLDENQISIFMDDGRPLPFAQLATLRAVQKRETIYQHQEVIHYADGTTLPVLVNAIALAEGKLTINHHASPADRSGVSEDEIAAIVVHQDVSALKEAERLKDDFIGIAAHELRTPLAILRGAAQMLVVQTLRGNGSTLEAWQMESLQDIDQSTMRLVELTEDLLDVTRLHAGRLELHLEPSDMVALTRRVLKRIQASTQHHQLQMTSLTDYLIANADQRRIEQVLANIINNAIKYSPAGGLIEIEITQDAAQQVGYIAIKDHGIGIPLQQQAHIFGRFVRADNARNISGTGLGLYLCRELIERHEGRIWFESRENQGSTFHIALPLLVDLDR